MAGGVLALEYEGTQLYGNRPDTQQVIMMI
jgi:hypothetical protein